MRTLSRRDAVLILLGASCMQILTFLFKPFALSSSDNSIVINSHHHAAPVFPDLSAPKFPIDLNRTPPRLKSPQPPPSPPTPPDLSTASSFPETSIVSHAPGWTIFSNIYMAEGTLFIVSPQPKSYFPPIRMMTSTGLEAFNTPENIQLREPTADHMNFISPQEAMDRWGGDAAKGERNRVWTVNGNTLLVNDPGQFLAHYYHFVAELLLGLWAFWTGSFPSPRPSTPPTHSIHSAAPPIDRLIFSHSSSKGWHDGPGFNAYILHSVFPSLPIEHQSDWEDRIVLSTPAQASAFSYHPNPIPHNPLAPIPISSEAARNTRLSSRVWHFPHLFLVDRSAAFRGELCGSKTQRTASEAWEVVFGAGGRKEGEKKWWEPVRRAVGRFAGISEEDLGVGDVVDDAAALTKIVITYISRQGSRRRLIMDDHDVLVAALEELVAEKNEAWKSGTGREWELNVVRAEQLSKDEQVRIMARTTILLGVHGNGLTHLVLMPQTTLSTVIEIFFPGGFAHDYEWTTRALGMKHFAFWNDTHHTYPNEPHVDYPEGFQGESIPVYGPAVAKLIEDRVEGRL